MQRATRQFAKRQLTWFRADPSVEWIDAEAVSIETHPGGGGGAAMRLIKLHP